RSKSSPEDSLGPEVWAEMQGAVELPSYLGIAPSEPVTGCISLRPWLGFKADLDMLTCVFG
ncbi:MAG: hypothetical protein ABSH28_24985, partial [Acidobacteriota bacterium]